MPDGMIKTLRPDFQKIVTHRFCLGTGNLKANCFSLNLEYVIVEVISKERRPKRPLSSDVVV